VRAASAIGPVLIVLGVVVLVVAFLRGEATLSLFVIFPVITATGGWAAVGVLLIIAGFFAFFLTLPSWIGELRPAGPSREPSGLENPASPQLPQVRPRRFGGVVFLGPIPIVFGSDATVAKWMLVVGVLLFVALLVLTIIALRGI